MTKKVLLGLVQRRLSIALLILLQVALIVFLAVNGSQMFIWVSYALTFISLLVVFHVVGASSSESGYKLLWIAVVLAFPVFGGLLYLVFHLQASAKRFKEDVCHAEECSKDLFVMQGMRAAEERLDITEYATQIRYLQEYAGYPVHGRTRSEYLTPGEVKFERLVEILEKAEKYIFLDYFSIQAGKFWDTVLEILKRKAAAGVDVRIIYDDIGCFLLLPPDYPAQLAKFGIKARVFNSMRPMVTVKQNNRDHRKIAVVDGKMAITGGINLADEYINAKVRYGHWKDAAILVEGEAAWSFTLMFLRMWSVCTKEDIKYADFFPWCDAPCPVEDDGLAQPYASSPLGEDHVGKNVYLHIIYNAKKYLYINTPYLVIDDNIMSALVLASKSGVDVRLVTPHHPDKPYVHMVTRSNYPELIEAGVKVYEYSLGFIHSKTFVSDDKVATVGSINLDYRSLYLSFECGVCLYGSSTVEDIRDDFLKTLENCRQVTERDYKTSAVMRLLQNILRLLSPLF